MIIIKSQVEKLKDCLEEFTSNIKTELNLLQSVPGVGKITSYYLLAVIGNHKRFEREDDDQGAKRLSGFIVYGVYEYSSGTRSAKGGISKRGNGRVRGLLHLAAMSAIQTDGLLKRRYEHLVEIKGSRKKSLFAISHTLLRRCYGVLKSGRPYNSQIPRSQGSAS